MIIKNSKELQEYKQVAQDSTQILRQLYDAVQIGITPLQIDDLAQKLCRVHGAKPAFLGVPGTYSVFQHATCIQVNDVVVHGVPDDRPFADGDLITVDFGIQKNGYTTDHCFTVGLGNVTQENLRLMSQARQTIFKAAQQAVVGKTTGHISHTIETGVEEAGFSVVREYIGHGIGRTLHDDPGIPGYGKAGSGPRLREGEVLCVEAQVNAGSAEVKLDADGWTVRTDDGSNSVMFEFMVVVEKNKPLILTPTQHWELVK
ncbi:MAG: type I methionyl aminopeptidase [Patescibacteria group bacterium]